MKKKILIIDDEPDVLTYLKTFLKDHGYSVCCAQDAASGLRMIPEERPDLICLDIMMPEKSGVSFYDHVRRNEEFCRIPVIIISGLNEASMHAMIDALELSLPSNRPYRFVAKPVDLNELLAAIQKALGRRNVTP